jgi:hypothetical protein
MAIRPIIVHVQEREAMREHKATGSVVPQGFTGRW